MGNSSPCVVCSLWLLKKKRKKKDGGRFSIPTTSSLPLRPAWLPPISARLFHPHRDGVAAPSQRQLAGRLRPGDCSTTSSATLTVRHSACGGGGGGLQCLVWVLPATAPCSPSASGSAPSPRGGSFPPGTTSAVTWPSLVSPGLNTVGEDFITEAAAVVRPGVSEAFPPCQEK